MSAIVEVTFCDGMGNGHGAVATVAASDDLAGDNTAARGLPSGDVLIHQGLVEMAPAKVQIVAPSAVAPSAVAPGAVAPRSHARVATICASVVVAMTALAFASVPLYRLFCQVTGYGGTTMRADKAPERIVDKAITVRFDANVAGGLAWQFMPLERVVTVKPGETMVVNYRATNPTDKPLAGSATYNVVPDQAGIFFNKLECFCFTEQLLQPGQSIDMPVQFFIDPAMATDKDGKRIHTVTLSYTFYPVAMPTKGAAVDPGKPRT